MYLLKITFVIICSFLSNNGMGANYYLNLNSENENHSIDQLIILNTEDGGPRDVVQTAIDITIHQPTASDLLITILDSNGEVFMVVLTDDLQTVISTENWETGNYTIETIDLGADSQSFSINKE